MSRKYQVSGTVTYSFTTEIEAEDYDDLNSQLDDMKHSGDGIDSWDLDFPDDVDVYSTYSADDPDGDYDRGDKEGPFEEDQEEEEVDEDEEESEEEEKSE